MKDLFSSYHKQKALSHLGILSLSAVLAISINMFVLNGPSGDSLKANITELQTATQVQDDIAIIAKAESINIVNSQKMDNVTEMSISFAYDQEMLSLWDTVSSINGANISKIETTPGFSSFIVVFDTPVNLNESSEIFNISYTRKSDETIYFNPININFTDSESNNYSLTASSLLF